MAEHQQPRRAGRAGNRFRLNLSGLEPGQERPAIAVTARDASAKVTYTASVDAQGNFDLPEEVLRSAHRVFIGPASDDPSAIDVESVLRYRPQQFAELARAGALNISKALWERWFLQIRCVTGSVRLCHRRPWWYWDLLNLATAPVLATPKLATRSLDLAAVSISQATRLSPAKSVAELIHWPFHCHTICNGTVEVYRRTCCCEPWIVRDPRLPDLVRELEDLTAVLPKFPPVPPNPPDPPPFDQALFFKEGALDERAVHAARDLAALRTLPEADAISYINARRYLFCRRYTCSTPVKVGEGTINPDGRFNICWLDFRRPVRPFCHDEYAYIVRQRIYGFTWTIYNGLLANAWFDQDDDATLSSYSPFAFACRDNGEPGSGAYVFLDIIGDTESWNLKTPNAAGWDRVAAPGYNDGTVFPAASPAAALGANLNRNWGGTLKLNYKFSEDMKFAPVNAKYYRVSISEADASGNPAGSRNFLTAGVTWEKSEPDGMGGVNIVPVNLGPTSAGTHNDLFLIPFDSDADWNAGQYHALIDTNDTRWSDPTKRHLVTVEVFDASGRRLRPTGSPATGIGDAETTAAFTYRRRFQDIGPMDNVPFGALTHMFWWDNRDLNAEIADLRMNGTQFNEECLFFEGSASSTFGIGYRAYHPNEMFQLSHGISWQRGLSGGSGVLLASSSANVGVPPAAPGLSPTETFGNMLDGNEKCAFTVFLGISSKTTDGDYLGNWGITKTAAFALEI